MPTQIGGYSFEWGARNKIFAIDVENDEIAWSFIDSFNKRKQSGFEKYKGKLPDGLVSILIEEFPA